MKKIIVIIITLAFAINGFAQDQYQVLVERPKEKTLKGIISKEILKSDTSFHWYADNQKGYTPNAAALNGLKKLADSVELLVFMGTWCEDSQLIIPKLYSLAETAGYPDSKITLIGVDRKKKTLSHLAEAMNVKNVPTIIVMKDGKETGRVIEFGKYGLFDMELGEILKKLTDQ